MAKRFKMQKRSSKKLFSRTAGNSRVHPKNMLATVPMRGGIRL